MVGAEKADYGVAPSTETQNTPMFGFGLLMVFVDNNKNAEYCELYPFMM